MNKESMMKKTWARPLLVALTALTMAVTPVPAAAHGGGVSEASALSMLPVAVSVAAPVAIVASGAALTVVSVAAVSEGTVWVLERASDGARASVHFAAGVSVAAGTAVSCVALGTGWLLSAAGQAIAFIPNEIGRALLHNERITR